MNKTITRLLGTACGLAFISALGISGMTASAYTPGDVAAYAYEIGYPNASDYINMAYAAIDSGKIPEEDIPGYCAQAMAALQDYANQRETVVEEVFDEAAQENGGSGQSTTTESTTSPTTPESGETGSESSGQLMSDADFTKLPLADKITYVNSLPESQRTEFLDSLSNEARNSILKEMETDKQLEMIESMMNTGDAFGVTVSVDSVSDDAIVISSRDEDGNLMSVTTLGNAVEETGISYTVPILLGGGAIVLACLGLGGVLWYTARKNHK